MAKREEPRPGKSKMTVMVFQLEGSDDTIQEGLRRVSDAVNGMVRHPARIVAVPPAAQDGAKGRDDEEKIEENTEPIEAVESDENGGGTSDSDESKPSAPRKPRVVRDLKILDLKLTSGNPPLAEFVKQKNVGDVMNHRYLVIAKWLKDNLNIAEITQDHIHTCYRHLGWQTPPDPAQALRKLKVQDCFNKGSVAGAYALNHIGENFVMKLGTS